MDVKSTISLKVDCDFTIDPHAMLEKASELIWENAIGAVFVTDQGEPMRSI